MAEKNGKNDGGGRGCAVIALVFVLAVIALVVIGSLSGKNGGGIGGFFADRLADLAVFSKLHPVAVIIIAAIIVIAIIGAIRG